MTKTQFIKESCDYLEELLCSKCINPVKAKSNKYFFLQDSYFQQYNTYIYTLLAWTQSCINVSLLIYLMMPKWH